jgi:AraC-like DNA-binding protein
LDALERELAEHLRAARDHAVTSRDFGGEAKLLRRPTKDELAKRAKVSPSAVTRCFQDESGAKLRMMWELAADLDAIIGYRED